MQSLDLIPEIENVVPEGPIRSYFELYKRFDIDGMTDFVASFLDQEVISLPHPDRPEITTYCRNSRHVDMRNELYFSDANNENRWCLVQFVNFFQFAVTEERLYNFVNEGSWFMQGLRRRFSERDHQAEFSSLDRRYGGAIIGSPRPFHFFYDQFMHLDRLGARLPPSFRRVTVTSDVFYTPAIYPDFSAKLAVEQEFYLMPAVCAANWLRGRDPKRFYEMCKPFEARLAASVPAPKEKAPNTLTLWFCVSVEKRSWLDQIEGFVSIAAMLRQHFDQVVVYLDGVTAGYGQTIVHKGDMGAADEIKERLEGICDVISLVGTDYRRKIECCHEADAFIADAGTGCFIPLRISKKGGVMIGNTKIYAFHGDAYGPNIRFLNSKHITDVRGERNKNDDYMNYSIDWRVIFNHLVDVIKDRKVLKKIEIESKPAEATPVGV